MTKRICVVDDCDTKHYGHGFCRKHYKRWDRHGDPLYEAVKPTNCARCQAELEHIPGYKPKTYCPDCVYSCGTVKGAPRTPASKPIIIWTAGYCLACRSPFLARGRGDDSYRSPPCRRQHRSRIKDRRRDALIRGAKNVENVKLERVAERDGWRCHICKRKVDRDNWSLDHLVPLSHGGDHTYVNVALAHHMCNSQRGNKGAVQLRLVS